MFHPDVVLPALLPHYGRSISLDAIDQAWLERVDIVVKNIAQVKDDLDATHHSTRLFFQSRDSGS